MMEILVFILAQQITIYILMELAEQVAVLLLSIKKKVQEDSVEIHVVLTNIYTGISHVLLHVLFL